MTGSSARMPRDRRTGQRRRPVRRLRDDRDYCLLIATKTTGVSSSRDCIGRHTFHPFVRETTPADATTLQSADELHDEAMGGPTSRGGDKGRGVDEGIAERARVRRSADG